MALAYVAPGVSVTELYSASVNPLLAANAQVCVVGLARGYQVATATVNMATQRQPNGTIVLTAPDTSVFSTVSGTEFFESVTNFSNPGAGTNPNGTYKQGTSQDFTATISGDKKVITITPTVSGASATGTGLMNLTSGVITIRYRYTPDLYFQATRYDNSAGIEAAYGPAFGPTGVVTPLSALAHVAFENGAQSVVIQPSFVLADATDPNSLRRQPTIGNGGEYFSTATWAMTLAGLRDLQDVNVIIPAVGQSQGFSDAQMLNVFEAIQDHIYFMKTEGQQIVGLFGEDSSASNAVATAATLRQHATTLRDRLGGTIAENLVLVSPSRFTRRSTTAESSTLALGGQYVAAAIGGMLANRPTQQPLTRKQVAGFVDIIDPRDKASKDADAAAGLMVIEQRGQNIQVRHALTLDTTSTARRELSVVRAKHRMIESIRDTIETQIIGEVPADGNAPMVVKQAVIGVLETLRSGRLLVDYYGVQTRVLTNDPTTVECRFAYRPAFPLNYVNISFSLDMSSGDLAATFDDTATV
jgi:hypothetical protein